MGASDAYGELHINAWDVAAGLMLIEEAGGFVNDFFAGDGLTKGNAILGCTPGVRRSIDRPRRWACQLEGTLIVARLRRN